MNTLVCYSGILSELSCLGAVRPRLQYLQLDRSAPAGAVLSIRSTNLGMNI